MSHNLEPKPQDNIELQVETPTNIIGSKCGSDNCIKAGFAYQYNNVLKKAQDYDWELEIHKNTPIKKNLQLVIKTLEVDND